MARSRALGTTLFLLCEVQCDGWSPARGDLETHGDKMVVKVWGSFHGGADPLPTLHERWIFTSFKLL